MDTISPTSSSSSTHQRKYHVFLSFRGEDTRNNFTDHLYAALNQKGIYTFRDNEKLEKGEPISPVLLKAIEDSLFAIVVLSKNYASSTWCLNELVKIMDCKKNMGLIVHPIFYDVEPTVVRKQTETYAQAFVEHEKLFSKNLEKVDTWRAALKDVSNLLGWSSENRLESEFIQEIIEEILLKLSSLLPKDTKELVGIDSRVEKLISLLAIGSEDDVHIIGIWGMGGIGKTTLARVVYDNVFNKFQGGCFIANVRSESEKCGLVSLQQKLIREILMGESVYIRDDCDGVRMIKNRLCYKKILLVLDDVDQFDQLEKLAGDSKWFGSGSRVIITTRDEHLLTRHKVHGIYEVQELNDYEALYLFSLKAFNKYHPPEDYLDLSTSFVHYAKGLPLAIDVLGSFLYNRSKKEWENALDRIQEHPEKEIIKILEISFNGLRDIEKEVFLHIACFFNMKDKDYIVEILDCLGLYPEIGLKVLIEKSLIKEDKNKYWMHDLLQIMGQDRVRRDYPQDPAKWSKLWLYKDIYNVSMKNTEMEAIQGLVLVLGELHKSGKAHWNLEAFDELHKSGKAHWNLEAFPKMPNLKLLIIHHVQLLHGPKHLSNNLRFLDWSEYPSKSLPSNFQPVELVELHLLYSKIEWLWKGTKHLDKLKLIKLNDSLNLIATPDFTGVPNLEKLVLNGCINLREIHASIMVLKRLTLLDLKNCKSLRSLPSKFEMESLEILILSGCSKIKRIPEFMGNMKRLSKLHLEETAITKLPFSIEYLTNLDSLYLRDCKSLVCLPSIICSFKSLKYINLDGCSKLDGLPEKLWTVESLEMLYASGITLREPPSSVTLENLKVLSLQGCKEPPRKLWNYLMPRRSLNPVRLLLPSLLGMRSLKRLNLSNCNLQIIPNDFGNLSSISHLNLSENHFSCLPESMVQLSKLEGIELNNCTRLRSLSQLPSTISKVEAGGCTSLETCPNGFKSRLFGKSLYLINCFKLVHQSDMFSYVLRMLLTAAREPPSSVTLENLEELSLQGCKEPPRKLWNNLFPLNLMPRRSLNPVSLLLPSLLGMRSLKSLDLSNCNLQIIPNDFGNLSSITELNLSENHFSCLPESMVQLSKLERIKLNNCTRLRSLSQLPSTISGVEAGGCTSLETCPNGFKSRHSGPSLYLINCFKLVRQSDMFSYVLRMLLRAAREEICKEFIGRYGYGFFSIVIPGREIPKWFTHQSVGNTVSAQVTLQNENKLIGIAMCVVPMAFPDFGIDLSCDFLSNGHFLARYYLSSFHGSVKIKSDHLWMAYIPSHMFSDEDGYERPVLRQIDENGFLQMELKFRLAHHFDGPEINKCGFRVVYEQDKEDIREMISA